MYQGKHRLENLPTSRWFDRIYKRMAVRMHYRSTNPFCAVRSASK